MEAKEKYIRMLLCKDNIKNAVLPVNLSEFSFGLTISVYGHISMKFFLPLFLLYNFITTHGYAQEICNNNIDDDNNGFTDTLDAACNTCDSITPVEF